ncbi:NAD(P)/FAD-dependent oxidoreductase [Candidatus Woesearchaeota archaeon]|nr:NAD(P)/FAD-dependent oxidoreductase [Candidatus Woesearchaeota archaeon]
MNMQKNEIWDFFVIGGGPTGIAASIYASRFMLKTMVVGKDIGGLIVRTHLVENYPGFVSCSGQELMDAFLKHAASMKVPVVEDEVLAVTKIKPYLFEIRCGEKTYHAKTVLFATGSKWRPLDVPGYKEFYAKGVSHCATCDAAFFKDKVVAVVGGSDSAAKEALLLTQFARKVYIVYRGEEIHPEPINGARVKASKKIEIISKTNIIEIKGIKTVTGAVLDKPYKGTKELPVDGIFIEIGHIPLSDLAVSVGVAVNDKREIMVGPDSRTNCAGIYAAGDITQSPYRQVITGAAEGVIAAFSAYEDLGKQ